MFWIWSEDMNIWFSVFDMVSNLPQYLYIMLNISKEYCEIHFSITHNIFSSFCMASPNDGREKGKRWPYRSRLHETLCQQQRRHCDPQWSSAGWQHCELDIVMSLCLQCIPDSMEAVIWMVSRSCLKHTPWSSKLQGFPILSRQVRFWEIEHGFFKLTNLT